MSVSANVNIKGRLCFDSSLSYWKTFKRICNNLDMWTFSTANFMKSNCRSSVSNENLTSNLRCAISVKCTLDSKDLVQNVNVYTSLKYFMLITCWNDNIWLYWLIRYIIKINLSVSFYFWTYRYWKFLITHTVHISKRQHLTYGATWRS